MKNITNVREDLVFLIELADTFSPVVIIFVIAVSLQNSPMPWQLKISIALAGAIVTHYLSRYISERLVKKIQ